MNISHALRQQLPMFSKRNHALKRLPLSKISRRATSSSFQIPTTAKTVDTNRHLFLIGSSILLATISIGHNEAKCDDNDDGEIEKEKETETEDVEEEEESCPFCRFFLESPCRDMFKLWQACIKVRPLDVIQKLVFVISWGL